MNQHNAATTKYGITIGIINISNQYLLLRSHTGIIIDAQVDLIVDKHMIDGYICNRCQIKADIDRIATGDSTSNMLDDLSQHAGSGDKMAAERMIRCHESEIVCRAVTIRVLRLEMDANTQMIVSMIAYMADVHIDKIADIELDDYRKLIDMIKCMSTIIDDICRRCIDCKHVMTKDLLDLAYKLNASMFEDINITHDDCRHELIRIIDNIDMKHDSISKIYDMMISHANRCLPSTKRVNHTTKLLVYCIVSMMIHRLDRSICIATHAREIAGTGSSAAKLRYRLQTHTGHQQLNTAYI